MKFFNTTGPVDPQEHYFIPSRLDEIEIYNLIAQKRYFILHAPRQTGKTTGILELVKKINEQGQYKALYVNVEAAQAARSQFKEGLLTILNQFESRIRETFGPADEGLQFFTPSLTIASISGNEICNFLEFWAQHSEKPIVLFIDEIDSLVGDTLISVLRQLRSGYTNRPKNFPQSVCLVGVRDVRDYRIWSDDGKTVILGGSAFNIKAESLRLADFSKKQVRDLYLQHSAETGQTFTDEAIDYTFHLTQGQPWLVNALAYQACFRDVTNRKQTITQENIEHAKEVLIMRCDTHIDALIDKLKEPRVRNIIEPILLGSTAPENFPYDDIQYVIDLGMLARRDRSLVIANPIYQEVFPRSLVLTAQEFITQHVAWYQRPDLTIDMTKLLDAFTQFFRENAEAWLRKSDYKEAGPHLLLMAFLQRIINGGGKIHREYALGKRRMDLLVLWHEKLQTEQRIVIEIKLWYGEKTLTDGFTQTAHYMDASNATQGHLIIFDRSPDKTWEEKIYHRTEKHAGKTIDVWGM